MSAVAVVNLWVRAFSRISACKFRLYIGLSGGGLALEKAHDERQKYYVQRENQAQQQCPHRKVLTWILESRLLEA